MGGGIISGIILYGYLLLAGRVSKRKNLAADFSDESTEKTLSNTKGTIPLAALRDLNVANGTKFTKEFLRVFSKMLNFRANKL